MGNGGSSSIFCRSGEAYPLHQWVGSSLSIPDFVTESLSQLSEIPELTDHAFKYVTSEDFLKSLQKTIFPFILQAKALSVFILKNLVNEGQISHVPQAMQAIGGMFLGVNIPMGILNTYSLVRNWKEHSRFMRGALSIQILGNTLLSSAGATLLISKVPALASLVGSGKAMILGKVAFIIGPIGMGLFSFVAFAKGGKESVKVVRFEKEIYALNQKLKDTDLTEIDKLIIQRELARCKAGRTAAGIDAIKYFLLGAGIGMGALIMSGLVTGSLASPLGWIAVGLVGGGMVMGLGGMGYKWYYARSEEKKETEGLAKFLRHSLNADMAVANLDKPGKMNWLAGRMNGAFTQEELKSILNTPRFPGNPTLYDLIDLPQRVL